jgi:CheY-like chemotaxis protein
VAAEFSPEVALLDIGLPVMDGYELGRRLREQPGLGGVYLAALTGYGQRTDEGLAREAGFNDHMVKPVELERLLTLLG